MSNKLTPKQQKFLQIYTGNGVDAARKAGYTGSDATLSQTAYELLRKPEIAEAIAKRQNKEINKIVTHREKLQKFWSDIVENEDKELNARLKASELLGKSEAVFLHKVEHSGVVKLEDLVAGSGDDESSED